jgi:hypothetical protein
MSDDEPVAPGQSRGDIDSVFRNGTLTGVGVLTGFTLTFLVAWAGNPLPWKWADVIAVMPLGIGALFQIKAIADLLSTESLKRARYDRIRVEFIIGLLLVVFGIGASLVLDALKLGGLDVGG